MKTLAAKHFGAAFVSALLAACTVVGRDYEAPSIELPSAWRDSSTAGEVDLAAWWKRFNDPTLDSLVERAAARGLDLREALARVGEARALRGVDAAERFPTLGASASYEHIGDSDNTPFGPFSPDHDLYTAGFDASWELDLWGRVRRTVEAADADLAASIADARDVAVTLAAETAVNYVELRAFQRRLVIARTNAELQDQTLALVRARYDAGLVGELDLAQATTNVETTRARVPELETRVREAENRLSVLVGLAPGALAEELAAAAPIPVAPLAIAAGVPADLLRRRADVRRAERELAAESARIGVAEGELYPRLVLAGDIGRSADHASDLTRGSSTFFGIGPSLSWNLFDGGRRRHAVSAQEARAEQARVRWERTVLRALEEADNAFVSVSRGEQRRRSLASAAEGARRAVELAKTQYGEGLSDFQTVLDSERVQADLDDQLAASDAAIATSVVTLYKALGGGWEARADLVRLDAR